MFVKRRPPLFRLHTKNSTIKLLTVKESGENLMKGTSALTDEYCLKRAVGSKYGTH